MKIAKRHWLWVAALGLSYLAASTDSDTVQERSRRDIERSQFGVLFRQTYRNPKAKVYGNNGAKTANYKDTLDIRDGFTYVITAKAVDANPIGVSVGDEMSGTVITIGDSPDGKFTMKTPLLEQRVTRGFYGSLNLSTELFIGEGSQAGLDRFYRLLEQSLNKYN